MSGGCGCDGRLTVTVIEAANAQWEDYHQQLAERAVRTMPTRSLRAALAIGLTNAGMHRVLAEMSRRGEFW